MMDSKKIIKDAWNTAWKHKKFTWLGLLWILSYILTYNYESIAYLFPQITIPEFLLASFKGEVLSRLLVLINSGFYFDHSLFNLIFTGFIYLLSLSISVFFLSAIYQVLMMIRKEEEPTYGLVLNRAFQSFPYLFLLTLVFSITRLFLDIGVDFFYYIDQYGTGYLVGKSTTIQLILLLSSITLVLIQVGFSFLAEIFIVAENLRPLDAMIRTWNVFIKPHFWKSILVLIITMVIELLITGLFLVINVPYGLLFYFTRFSPPSFIENMSFSLFIIMSIAAIPLGAIGIGFRVLLTKSVMFGFYDQIKAIDRAKEAAEEFDELETVIDGENSYDPTDDLPSGD
jgi:hypothetical protein